MKRTVICEYVGKGHPDKVADQISDALLDAFLEKDPDTRAGIEVMVKDNIVVLGGEVKTTAQIDYEYVVRRTINSIDYPENHHLGFDDIRVINLIGKQSPEISRSVDREDGIIGAGDQGFCVGFASNETDTYMPLGAYLARQLCKCADSSGHHQIGPDIKSQVVVTYDEDNKPHVDSILISSMHQCSLDECRDIIRQYIMTNGMGISDDLFNRHVVEDRPDITINPSGEWHVGGSISDCGMTNRKIVVDQYGGYAPVGGGGLSGKDMSKVDRSATYMCRFLAKNIVAAGITDTAKVELAYMIGIPQPCAINVDLNLNKHLTDDITAWIRHNIDLSPRGIMKRFDGSKPRYNMVTQFGHFGTSNNELVQTEGYNYFPWEELTLVKTLQTIFYV